MDTNGMLDWVQRLGRSVGRRSAAVFSSIWMAKEWAAAVLVFAFVGFLLLSGFSASTPRAAPVVAPALRPQPLTTTRSVVVAEGDTLLGILASAGVEKEEANGLLGYLAGSFGPHELRPGQEITVTLRADTVQSPARLVAFRVLVDPAVELEAMRTDWGGFVVRSVPQSITHRTAVVAGEITSTLYDSAERAGVPVPALMEMIRAFSFDVDFQRAVHPGNRYDVLLDRAIDSHDRIVDSGEVLYAALRLDRSTLRIYRFTTSRGSADFFDEHGRSVRKTLIRTPIEGAWISSGYGYRMDPIYGYTKFHPALDFAAPCGTPIIAAGDGTVSVAGFDSDYGNYVKIRHRNEYSTLYAHLSSFARGIRPGAEVAQGQIIGFVGLTGLTTGPHLHYEVMWRSERVNPATVVSPPGPVLEGTELDRFMTAKNRIDESVRSLGGTL